MKFAYSLLLIAILGMGGLSAQQDTAQHRAVYQDINSKAGAMQVVSGEDKGEAGVVKLTGWKEGGTLRKIVANSAVGEVTEYYLEGEKPLFVFRMSKDGDGNKVEERLYFVLKADAEIERVLGNPGPHVGKTCRVTWKKSMEEIPEAGGKMEIEQLVAVEWLK